jgi:hypothetical protein
MLQQKTPMSLTTGLIAIRGQQIDNLSEIFGFWRLVDTQKDQVLKLWSDVEKVIDEELINPDDYTQKRVVWFDNNWTIIEDLSFILSSEEDVLAQISQTFSTPVFSMQTQGTSSCYSFTYSDIELKRSFSVCDGEVLEDFGTPLTQEKNYKIGENTFYDDIHGVAKQFGINWDNAKNIDKFTIKTLDNSEELNSEIEKFKIKPDGQAEGQFNTKPWWRFW